jgi:hypothetical protein
MKIVESHILRFVRRTWFGKIAMKMSDHRKHKKVVRALIQLGSGDQSSLNECQPEVKPELVHRHLPLPVWKKLARKLSEADLAALVKGVVLAEEARQYIGSTTKVPHLIHPYAERFTVQKADDLVKWCLAKSTNCYVPFGSSGPKILSYSDWIKNEQEKPIRHLERLSLIQKEKDERLKQKQKSHQIRNVEGLERGEAIANLIQHLRSQTTTEAFATVVENDVPLKAVPLDALISISDIVSLIDGETKSRLLAKIGRKKKGFWGKIARQLKEEGVS